MRRALAATRKRRAHRLANDGGTEFQNDGHKSLSERAVENKKAPRKALTSHTYWLAGAPGIEPGNGGIKIRCLTAWLRPNNSNVKGQRANVNKHPFFELCHWVSSATHCRKGKNPSASGQALIHGNS